MATASKAFGTSLHLGRILGRVGVKVQPFNFRTCFHPFRLSCKLKLFRAGLVVLGRKLHQGGRQARLMVFWVSSLTVKVGLDIGNQSHQVSPEFIEMVAMRRRDQILKVLRYRWWWFTMYLS